MENVLNYFLSDTKSWSALKIQSFPGSSPFLGNSATTHFMESLMRAKVSTSVEETDLISELSRNLNNLACGVAIAMGTVSTVG